MVYQEPSINDNEIGKWKVYKKRWLILSIFCFYAISNRAQFLIYSVISHILVEYYGISQTAVQWTSLIGVLNYLIFNIPGSYILDKLGLRWTVIIGTIGTATGLWIKVFSVHPDRFWVLLLGQGITAACRVLISPLPLKIAATWFPTDKVGLTCSIGIIAIKIGSVFGSLISSLLVPQEGTQEEIEKTLCTLAIFLAVFATIVLPIELYFFSESPPTPPSAAQSSIRNDTDKKSFKESIKVILCNRSFVVFLFIFGITNGSAFPLVIIANEIILRHHPNAGTEIGYLTALCLTSGIIAAFLAGFILDKFRRFRETTIMVYIGYAVSLVLFISTLHVNLSLLYCTITVVGFFGGGLVTVGFNLGVELTYPESEGTVAGLLMTSSEIFGILFTMGYSNLFTYSSELFSNVLIGSIMLLTMLLFFLVKFDLRRQRIEKKDPETENKY